MAFDLKKITSALHISQLKREGDSVVGIDVGASAVKVVQMKLKDGVPTLETYGELQLGPYGGVEIGRTTNLSVAKATEAVIDILRESGVSAEICGMPINYSSTFVTVITVDTKEEDEIAAKAPLEARKYIPVPLNEVTLDWFPVALKSDKKHTKLLLSATHREALNRYDVIVSNAKLEQKVSEIEPFSAIRAIASQNDKTIAIIDIGAGTTKLYIANEGMIARTHSIRMGGAEITNNLTRILQVEFQEAEETKRMYGLSSTAPTPEIAKSIRSVFDRGFREINQVMKEHMKSEEVEIEKVILTGGGAMTKDIVPYVTNELQKEVQLAEPFNKVAYPAFLEDTLREVGPAFSVAIGVAIRAVLQDDE